MDVDARLARPSRAARTLRGVRRGVLRRRRLLAALLAGVAVASGVHAASADPLPTRPVWVVVRDLPAGAELTVGDLERRDFAPGSVPDGALPASPAGEVLAAPVRSGEPVTDVRLWDDPLLTTYDGRTSVPVRMPDPDAVGLLEPGDALDLWATGPRGGPARLVVADARVVSVPEAGGTDVSAVAGRLVVLAVPTDAVASVAAAQSRDLLSFALASLG